jgi:hypothetical protein
VLLARSELAHCMVPRNDSSQHHPATWRAGIAVVHLAHAQVPVLEEVHLPGTSTVEGQFARCSSGPNPAARSTIMVGKCPSWMPAASFSQTCTAHCIV